MLLNGYDITVPFNCLFAAAFLNVIYYLYNKWRLVNYIKENRERLYRRLGSPKVDFRPEGTLEDWISMISQTKYIHFGDFSQIADETYVRLAKRLRLSATFHIISICGLMCTMPFIHSSSKGPSGTGSGGMISAAYSSYKQGRYHEALNLLDQPIEKYPGDFSGYYYRAFVFEKMGRYHDALSDFVRCSKIKPDSREIFLHIDWILSRNQQWDEVIRHWNRYLRDNPNDARAYLERGGAYWHMQNLENAMHDAEKACELGNEEGCLRYRQAKLRLGTSYRD